MSDAKDIVMYKKGTKKKVRVTQDFYDQWKKRRIEKIGGIELEDGSIGSKFFYPPYKSSSSPSCEQLIKRYRTCVINAPDSMWKRRMMESWNIMGSHPITANHTAISGDSPSIVECHSRYTASEPMKPELGSATTLLKDAKNFEMAFEFVEENGETWNFTREKIDLDKPNDTGDVVEVENVPIVEFHSRCTASEPMKPELGFAGEMDGTTLLKDVKNFQMAFEFVEENGETWNWPKGKKVSEKVSDVEEVVDGKSDKQNDANKCADIFGFSDDDDHIFLHIDA